MNLNVRLPREAEQTFKPAPEPPLWGEPAQEFQPNRSLFCEIKSHRKMEFRMGKCHLNRNANKDS